MICVTIQCDELLCDEQISMPVTPKTSLEQAQKDALYEAHRAGWLLHGDQHYCKADGDRAITSILRGDG